MAKRSRFRNERAKTIKTFSLFFQPPSLALGAMAALVSPAAGPASGKKSERQSLFMIYLSRGCQHVLIFF